jgi:hypothetical protein
MWCSVEQSGDSRDFGLPGVEIAPGDHLCALYLGERERDDIVLPYLRTGLRDGDKCVCVVESSPGHLRHQLGDDGEIGAFLASGQLELLSVGDAYLRKPPFRAESMIAFWDERVGPAVKSGAYVFARVSGEMPLDLREGADRQEFFRYEAELNRYAARYPQVVLCLYDLERFGGGFLVDLLRTHPKVLMGGLVLENPHYRAPMDLTRPD